jgi:hypothetical protein
VERAGIPVSDIRRALGAMEIGGVVGVIGSSDIVGERLGIYILR